MALCLIEMRDNLVDPDWRPSISRACLARSLSGWIPSTSATADPRCADANRDARARSATASATVEVLP
jgi:hypothetical protein